MLTLSAVDMRRIIAGGERFLLIEVTSSAVRGSAVHISYDDDFLQNVLAYSKPGSLPVIIQGDAADARIVEQAAAVLRTAGFLEVWTFFETWPCVEERTTRSRQQHSVFSDPDADEQASYARSFARK